MTALAQHHKQSLAILLLDFEKAYDKVDWDFLEAVLLKLGFPCAWIKGVSALYRHASKSVLFLEAMVHYFQFPDLSNKVVR